MKLFSIENPAIQRDFSFIIIEHSIPFIKENNLPFKSYLKINVF